MLPTKFQVNLPFGSGEEVVWFFCSGEEAKNRFSRWRSSRNDLSYLLSKCYPTASYQVSSQLAFFLSISHPYAFYRVSSQLAFRHRKKAKNRFSKIRPGGHLRNHFSYFLSMSTRCLLPNFKSNGLSVQMKQKIDFQDGHHGRHLGFPIRTILAFFFYLRVTPMLTTKLQINWPFSSGGEVKIDPDASYRVSS